MLDIELFELHETITIDKISRSVLIRICKWMEQQFNQLSNNQLEVTRSLTVSIKNGRKINVGSLNTLENRLFSEDDISEFCFSMLITKPFACHLKIFSETENCVCFSVISEKNQWNEDSFADFSISFESIYTKLDSQTPFHFEISADIQADDTLNEPKCTPDSSKSNDFGSDITAILPPSVHESEDIGSEIKAVIPPMHSTSEKTNVVPEAVPVIARSSLKHVAEQPLNNLTQHITTNITNNYTAEDDKSKHHSLLSYAAMIFTIFGALVGILQFFFDIF